MNKMKNSYYRSPSVFNRFALGIFTMILLSYSAWCFTNAFNDINCLLNCQNSTCKVEGACANDCGENCCSDQISGPIGIQSASAQTLPDIEIITFEGMVQGKSSDKNQNAKTEKPKMGIENKDETETVKDIAVNAINGLVSLVSAILGISAFYFAQGEEKVEEATSKS